MGGFYEVFTDANIKEKRFYSLKLAREYQKKHKNSRLYSYTSKLLAGTPKKRKRTEQRGTGFFSNMIEMR